jgi:hypothetical protein
METWYHDSLALDNMANVSFAMAICNVDCAQLTFIVLGWHFLSLMLSFYSILNTQGEILFLLMWFIAIILSHP